MQLNPSEISELIKNKIQNLDVGAETRTQGTVVTVTDGICRIHGLADVMQGEMIELPGNLYGLALNLERDSVGAIVAARVIHGFGFGLSTTFAAALVADVIPASRRGEGIGYFGLGSTIAGVLFGGVIFADYWFYRGGRYPLLHSARLPRFNWLGLVAYAAGAVVAYLSPWIAPLVGISVSALVYIALALLSKRQPAAVAEQEP